MTKAFSICYRFEHSSRLHKKITTRVHFPEILDMTPFISNARNNSASGGDKKDYQFIPRFIKSHDHKGDTAHSL
jgi:hypothetical protein